MLARCTSSHVGQSLGISLPGTPDASPTGELRIKAGRHRGHAGEYLVAMSLLQTWQMDRLFPVRNSSGMDPCKRP
eukprot:5513284-Amphidinium_carterae.1